MTVVVLIAVVIDIAIYIAIITNVEGRVRIPYLVFIVPVVAALAIGRFADAALAKRSPHLVPGYTAQQYQPYPGAVPAQQGYGQVQQPMAPQGTGYGQPQYGQAPSQVPSQQVAPGTPQQAAYGQQPGQAQQGQYGQTPTNQVPQAPQNQQPYGHNGQMS
ncbi:hypothetical protein [Actinomyces viscosus]|uniref:Uncharacterized protein n=2 Tax=Actinomyces viscosus TaxID=1656 RepID=A0A3S4VG05_ACTVI|nr:hypothetical protein [Actinomyces viscosus]VEI18674.1 Uncharacterised protein [Actinomyces viscosus]